MLPVVSQCLSTMLVIYTDPRIHDVLLVYMPRPMQSLQAVALLSIHMVMLLKMTMDHPLCPLPPPPPPPPHSSLSSLLLYYVDSLPRLLNVEDGVCYVQSNDHTSTPYSHLILNASHTVDRSYPWSIHPHWLRESVYILCSRMIDQRGRPWHLWIYYYDCCRRFCCIFCWLVVAHYYRCC